MSNPNTNKLPERRKQPQNFAFVNTTGPTNGEAGENRTFIRKHVMREIGKSRRKEGTNRRKKLVSFPLHLSTDHPSTEDAGQSAEDARLQMEWSSAVLRARGLLADQYYNPEEIEDINKSTVEQERSKTQMLAVRLRSRTPITLSPSVIAMDPFQKYPVEMDTRAHELVAFTLSHDTLDHRALFESWYSVGLGDYSSWNTMLSNAALHAYRYEKLPQYQEEAARYSNRSITLLNKRLADPVQAVSDGVIYSIIGLMCNGWVVEDYQQWGVHLAGLMKILDMRGGVHTIDKKPELRWTLAWGEGVPASNLDTVPNFPFPYHLLSSTAQRSRQSTEHAIHPAFETIRDICSNDSRIWTLLQYMTNFVDELRSDIQHCGDHAWSRQYYMYDQGLPLLHELLHIQQECIETDEFGRDTVEFLRLTMLLCLAEIRRKFGTCPLDTKVQISKLRQLLQSSSLSSSLGSSQPFHSVLLWGLTMGVIEASVPGQREWYLEEINKHIEGSDLNLDSVFDIAKDIFWLEDAHGPLIKHIRHDIENDIENLRSDEGM